MMINILNTKAEKTGTMKLPEEIFGVKVSPQLLAQAVRVYLANQRTARARVKTRGEIRGSRIKIWRQKGTGRARHGDKYAPIFVGGGIAHGPKGTLKRLVMPKKMRKKALFGALSGKVKEKQFLVVEGLVKIKPKTKEMAQVLKRLTQGLKGSKTQRIKKDRKKSKEKKTKILLVLKTDQKKAVRAARNISNVQVAYFNQLNCYEVLNNCVAVFSKEAIKDFIQLNR